MKKVACYSIVTLLMCVLLYLIHGSVGEVQRLSGLVGSNAWASLPMSLYGFLFGMLIEWRAVLRIFKGNVAVNWLVIPSVILIVVSFIPRIYWIQWFGLREGFIAVISSIEIQLLLNVLAGILIIRAIHKRSLAEPTTPR